MNDWSSCRNILCIRADNMGDLLMSSPAIRALKETYKCRITLLTSSMAAPMAKHLPDIDEILIYNFPWVKNNSTYESAGFFKAVEELKSCNFDAAVIFTVYSQSPLPAAMLAYLANIPKRLAYCRENPYGLLTDWVPDKEPYALIRHQVRRDMELVAIAGAVTINEKITLQLPAIEWHVLQTILKQAGVDPDKPWLILHAGVSEKKREYPVEDWINAGRKLVKDLGYQVLITGTASEKIITDTLKEQIGHGAFSLGGAFTLEAFIVLIHHAPLVISVNTGTIHIAAAVSTPVIVLYALTNPQHLPWKVCGRALFFDVPPDMQSKNEIIRYVNEYLIEAPASMASPDVIVSAAAEVLQENGNGAEIPEMIPLRNIARY